MNRLIFAWATVSAVALCAGCAMTHRYDAAEVTPKVEELPAATKRPVHAGVYYSPQFANEHRARTTGPTTFDVPIGAASVQLFDELFSKVFIKTSRISNLSPEELTAKGVDVTVAPTLEHFDFRTGFDPDSVRWSVAYRITLYSRQGVPVASWVVSGNGPEGFLTTSIENDLKDAGTKFLNGFEHNAGPALAAVARNREARTAAIAPREVVISASLTELPGLDPKVVAALQKEGVVPIRVTARSTSERHLLMRASDMRLHRKNGALIAPSSMTSILNVLEEDEGEAYNTWFTGVFFLGSLGGMAAAAADTQSQGEQREAESGVITKSLFSDRKLDKGQEESGIVLFRLPKGAQRSEGAILTAWIVDPIAADGAQVSVAIAGFANVRNRAPDSAVGTVKGTEKPVAEKPARRDMDKTPEPTAGAVTRTDESAAEQSGRPPTRQWPPDSAFPVGRGGLGQGSYPEHEDAPR